MRHVTIVLVAFRDELEAAQARIAALEEELAEARVEIERLKLPPPAPAPLARKEPEPPRLARRLGSVHYHPPPTYVPFLHLYRSAVVSVWERRPTIERPSSDAVWRWAFYYVGLPLTYGVRMPLYFASVAIALAAAAAVCIAATFVTLPFLALSRLSFSPARPDDGASWWTGAATPRAGAMFLWILMSFSLAPLLLFTTSLLHDDG